MNDEAEKTLATEQRPETATTPVSSTETMSSCKGKEVTDSPRR